MKSAANTDNKVHKLVMVFAICSRYLDSEPKLVPRSSYPPDNLYLDGKNHAPVSLRFVGAQHASLIPASEKSYPKQGILLSGLHSH
jgi:hypothetical protein